MDAVHHPAGEGERHALGASETVIKATGAHTGGAVFVGEITIAPGFPGPPPHTHDRLTDMFYVLEGTLTMSLAGETMLIEPGGFVCVPPGTVHAFSNPTEEPVRFLNFNTPSGWEGYMRELGEAAAEGELTQAAIGRIASRYDFNIEPS